MKWHFVKEAFLTISQIWHRHHYCINKGGYLGVSEDKHLLYVLYISTFTVLAIWELRALGVNRSRECVWVHMCVQCLYADLRPFLLFPSLAMDLPSTMDHGDSLWPRHHPRPLMTADTHTYTRTPTHTRMHSGWPGCSPDFLT